MARQAECDMHIREEYAHGGYEISVVFCGPKWTVYCSRSRRWGLTPWKRTGGLHSVNGYDLLTHAMKLLLIQHV